MEESYYFKNYVITALPSIWFCIQDENKYVATEKVN